jgi:hypothetical protein
MKQELSGWDRTKAIIAKWIMVNIAMRISPLAVLSLCLEISRGYQESIEAQED